MTTIVITWNAGFGYPLSDSLRAELAEHGIPESLTLTYQIDTQGQDDLAVAERLFEETNLYEGAWWDVIAPALPDNRHHTALSVGDVVTIDGRVYGCAPVGWRAAA